MTAVRTSDELRKRLNILRAAGAIADYRVVSSSGRSVVQVSPGDSLAGDELRTFIAEMMGADLARDQITVVDKFK